MGVIIEFIKFDEGLSQPVVVYRTAPYSEVDAIVQVMNMTGAMKERGATHYRLVDRDDGEVRETKVLDA